MATIAPAGGLGRQSSFPADALGEIVLAEMKVGSRMKAEDIVKKYIKSKIVENKVSRLPSETKVGLVVTMLAMSLVNSYLIDEVKENEDYQEIVTLFKLSKDKGKLENNFVDIYQNRLKACIKQLEQKKENIVRKILGKQEKNARLILESNTPNKQAIYDRIWENSVKKKSNSTLVAKLGLIDQAFVFFKNLVFNLTDDMLKLQVADEDILEYFSYIVYRPEIMYLDLRLLEPAWDKFPLKWLIDEIPISSTTYLFDVFSRGEDVSEFFIDWFEGPSLDELVTLVEGHFFEEVENRKSILLEIVDCYKQQKYASVICTILPQIEGLLWGFSKRFHIKTGDIYKDDSFEVLLSKDGSKEITILTVGSLLNHTNFGNLFDSNFINYFCDELYCERNPILHGTNIQFASKLNAAKKLATFYYLMKTVNKAIKKFLWKTCEQVITEDMVQKIVSNFESDSKKSND